MLLDDAIHHREPQPRPLPLGLGREEWLEDPEPGLVIHADAGVGQRQDQAGARQDTSDPSHRVLVEDSVQGRDDEPSAVRHGVARVHSQVHQHLLDLAGIHFDTPGGARHRVDLDVLADQPSEHRHDVADHHVKVDHHRLEHLPAAESQELPRQGGRAVRGGLDEPEVVSPRVAGRQVGQGELAPPDDHGQQVIEVVRDAARQPAQGFHLLGLAE